MVTPAAAAPPGTAKVRAPRGRPRSNEIASEAPANITAAMANAGAIVDAGWASTRDPSGTPGPWPASASQSGEDRWQAERRLSSGERQAISWSTVAPHKRVTSLSLRSETRSVAMWTCSQEPMHMPWSRWHHVSGQGSSRRAVGRRSAVASERDFRASSTWRQEPSSASASHEPRIVQTPWCIWHGSLQLLAKPGLASCFARQAASTVTPSRSTKVSTCAEPGRLRGSTSHRAGGELCAVQKQPRCAPQVSTPCVLQAMRIRIACIIGCSSGMCSSPSIASSSKPHAPED
mmetsp:Transcript_34556/g.98275  ORF Transcript_34556/g.98275 Transcript_34556/m.98275 type:complete len:290 (+) Transcript_34556:364-1233(+)